MTTPACPMSWDEFPGLRHQDEVMGAGPDYVPSQSEQAKSHGALYIPGGVPAPDLGPRQRPLPAEVVG